MMYQKWCNNFVKVVAVKYAVYLSRPPNHPSELRLFFFGIFVKVDRLSSFKKMFWLISLFLLPSKPGVKMFMNIQNVGVQRFPNLSNIRGSQFCNFSNTLFDQKSPDHMA